MIKIAENRYFKMIYLLLEKGSMTAPQLAKHFEVSVRTIYRDIDILSSAGIPIYATQGKGGGISIQDSFIRQAPSQIFVDLEQSQEELISLKLIFEKELAFKVYDYFDSITEREDGKLLVEASLPNNDWLYSFILSFCDKVEVIEPEAIRKEVKEKIKKIKNKYIT